MKKDNIFEMYRLDGILQSIKTAFLSRVTFRGMRSGISPVASKIRQTLIILTMSRISITFMIFVKIIPHTFILTLRSNIEVEDWELPLWRDLPIGQRFIL